jgi:hypothetical protein
MRCRLFALKFSALTNFSLMMKRKLFVSCGDHTNSPILRLVRPHKYLFATNHIESKKSGRPRRRYQREPPLRPGQESNLRLLPCWGQAHNHSATWPRNEERLALTGGAFSFLANLCGEWDERSCDPVAPHPTHYPFVPILGTRSRAQPGPDRIHRLAREAADWRKQ